MSDQVCAQSLHLRTIGMRLRNDAGEVPGPVSRYGYQPAVDRFSLLLHHEEFDGTRAFSRESFPAVGESTQAWGGHSLMRLSDSPVHGGKFISGASPNPVTGRQGIGSGEMIDATQGIATGHHHFGGALRWQRRHALPAGCS